MFTAISVEIQQGRLWKWRAISSKSQRNEEGRQGLHLFSESHCLSGDALLYKVAGMCMSRKK